jgi:hypothetical protein
MFTFRRDVDQQTLNKHGMDHQNQLVLLLNKSLYGLKQAGRMWNHMLSDFLLKNGFKRSMTDKCLYYKTSTHGFIVVGVYVDDILVTGTTQQAVDDFNEVATKGKDCHGSGTNDHGFVKRISYGKCSCYKTTN